MVSEHSPAAMENSYLTTSNSNQLITILKSNTISFNHPISIKLDNKNYLFWKQQVMPTICGHELEKFIAGPRFWRQKYDSAEKEVVDEISKEYQLWKKQDQLLISWLLSSMSETMLTRVVGCDKAYHIWDRVQEFFLSQTRAKVRQFKMELRYTKKAGDKTMSEYTLRIKSLVDALINIRCNIIASKHTQEIFEGLGGEYDLFICSINSRLEPYTMSEIEALLLAQEVRFEKHIKIASSTDKVSVNVATGDIKDKTNPGRNN